MEDYFTDELVAYSYAVVDAVVADNEAVDEGQHGRSVPGHSRVTAQLVHQQTEPVALTLGDLPAVKRQQASKHTPTPAS